MQWPPTRPGTEAQEIPLGAGRLEHFAGVDADLVEDRNLVHQGDVDVALGVLDHLGRFGHLDRRCLVDAGDHRAIEIGQQIERFGVFPGDDLDDLSRRDAPCRRD
jgi:hypothetical protein